MQVKPFFPVVHPTGAQPVRLWVCPGQGSQSVGMGQKLYDSSRTYRETFDRGHAALVSEGVDLRRLAFEGPAGDLTRTLHAQPALLVSNVALAEHLRIEEGIAPSPGDLLAGHSLGEWTAYTISGALTVEQGALAVYWRGRLMEEAFPFDPATRPMTAILGLSDQTVISACAGISREGHIVVAANFNAPGQVVISGHPAAVAEASDLLKSRGAGVSNAFPVAGPFHTPILSEAREKLAAKIAELGIEFSIPEFQIISNFTGREIEPVGDHLGSLLNQLTGSVRWTASMVRAWELGAVEMVSLDVSGNVLQGFAKKIFSRERPVQIVDPTISMHQHALRQAPGSISTTRFAEDPVQKRNNCLEFSYNAGAIVKIVRKLLKEGDVQTALLALKNTYNSAREAAMRELKSHADSLEVIQAMREGGFVDEAGDLIWPDPVVRDLVTHTLPPDSLTALTLGKDSIFSKLEALSLAPIDQEDLIYYVASRWNGDAQRLEKILSALRYLLVKGDPKKHKKSLLPLIQYKDQNGESQKGIDSWEAVILYVDGEKDVQFPHPGAMKQGDIL